MMRHYTDLGSASDWLCHEGNLLQPIRSTTQIGVVTGHQYEISALIPQMSFLGKPAQRYPARRIFLDSRNIEGDSACRVAKRRHRKILTVFSGYSFPEIEWSLNDKVQTSYFSW